MTNWFVSNCCSTPARTSKGCFLLLFLSPHPRLDYRRCRRCPFGWVCMMDSLGHRAVDRFGRVDGTVSWCLAVSRLSVESDSNELQFRLKHQIKTYFAWNESTVAHAVERRRLDGPLERVKLILPIVEPQMALQRPPCILLWTLHQHLIPRFPRKRHNSINFHHSHFASMSYPKFSIPSAFNKFAMLVCE